jgi:acyl dehydratase
VRYLEEFGFAREFDPQLFHVDPERARESIYGGLIAGGWHSVGAFRRLAVDGLINDTICIGSPGLDQVRWLKPVHPGDTPRARMTDASSAGSSTLRRFGGTCSFKEGGAAS